MRNTRIFIQSSDNNVIFYLCLFKFSIFCMSLFFLIHSGKFSPEMKHYNARYEYQTHDQDSGGSNGKTRRIRCVESKHTV